jgi:hypothetical protein
LSDIEGEIIMMNRPVKRKYSPILWLLIIPFIVLLIPPIYNRVNPELFGIPFFYWFQLSWVIITAIITAIVYFVGA